MSPAAIVGNNNQLANTIVYYISAWAVAVDQGITVTLATLSNYDRR